MSEGAAMERLFMVLAAVVCTCAVRASAGDDVGPSIEALGAPIDLQQTDEASALDDLIEPVGLSRGESVARRLYVLPPTNRCLLRAVPLALHSKRSTATGVSSSKAGAGIISSANEAPRSKRP